MAQALTDRRAQLLEPLAHWFRNEGEAVLDATAGAILAEVPTLAHAGPDGESRLRQTIRSHATTITAFLGSDPESEVGSVPAELERYARYLALHGTPIAVLLRSFEVGHSVLWDHLARALREGPYRVPRSRHADVLELASARFFDYIQAASAFAVGTYTREEMRLARRAHSRRAELIGQLLDGVLDESAAEEGLGYRLGTTHIGYVAWVPGVASNEQLDAFVADLRRSLHPLQHISVPSGDRAVHGWFTVTDPGWAKAACTLKLPADVRVAFGAGRSGLNGFRTTHRDALEARRVGEALGGTGPLLYEDVAVAALASRDFDAATDFVAHELGRLVEGDGPMSRLLQTLSVYLDERASPTRTGRRLGIHRNTVIQRVERVEELLARRVDPSSLSLRVALELVPLVAPAAREGQETPREGE